MAGHDDVSQLLLLPVIQQPALALRRMRPQTFFVGLGAPAGAVRDDEVAVDDLGVLGMAKAFEGLRGPQKPWPTPPKK